MTFFEFGSGKSTLFLAPKVGKLISIEHHKEWYLKIKDRIEEENCANTNYVLCEPKSYETKKEIEIRCNQQFDTELTNYSSYYEYIDEFPDEHFDFVLIDGRARVECCRRAVPKLKSGGIIILDNSERIRYKPIHEMLKDWPKINTTTGLTDTTLWFKP